MRDVLLAFVVGTVTGVVFAFSKLPVPAPPTVAGVVGILGITVGWFLVRRYVNGN